MPTSNHPNVTAHSIQLAIHGEMLDWLAGSGGSLAVTTYNAGKLALFSAPAGQLETRIWKFPRPMGMAAANGRLAVAFRKHIAIFQDDRETCVTRAAGNDVHFRLDKLFRTGRLDVHDVAFAGERLYFANTRFSCLARPSDQVCFLRSWQPAFIREMIPADCCHLNGVGVRDKRPAMVTAFAQSNQPRGWREMNRFSSGVVIDVRSRSVVVSGLNMPHSPRFDGQQWWLCASGAGELSTFDPQTGSCASVAALPGFTRGLCLLEGLALVGTSRIREEHILDSPPLRAQQAKVRAGVSLVDCQNGRELGALEFVRGGSEVFEVVFLPGVQSADFGELPQPAE